MNGNKKPASKDVGLIKLKLLLKLLINHVNVFIS